MAKMNLGRLNNLYKDADAADREVFAEMRSNVLLIAGLHYSKANRNTLESRAREHSNLTEQQKLRLTKNHIHKIHKRYVQAVLSFASGITISPQMDGDMQDQKAADLNLAVWQDGKYRYKLKEQIRKWAGDFCGIGEVALKLFWDPNDGALLGYGQATHPATGEPQFEDDGSPVADEKQPVFQGKMVFERLFGFNLLRDPAAKDMLDSAYTISRKMTPTSWLKQKYKDQPEKLKFITQDHNDEFIVFDASRMGYERSKNHTMVKEIFWRPCSEYPEGYFAIWTSGGVLEEGVLPFGIYPIIWKGFDENPSSPRATSLVKQARPYQAEINRASSQMAMHQITISDDKILYQKGAQVTSGALLPGVRGIAYQGKEPSILAGREGGQYLNYILAQIEELYKVLDVDELDIEKNGQLEPFALLFRAARQKQKFSIYSEKFEEFLVEVVKTFLELAKKYYPDDMLIPAIGAKEYVNMAEFRSTVPLNYQIHVEAMDDTLESKFGKQISIQHMLQYAGPQLTRDDIGKLARNLPFANGEEIFDDLTMDYDNAKNDMLALERGEFPQPQQDDEHTYIIKKLSRRMKQPDFRYLKPQIKQLYAVKKQIHEQMQAAVEQKIIDAKNEYIPADGPMIACDMYVENPTDPKAAPKRARIPQRAIDWLIEKLKAQGADLAKLESMNQGSLGEMADMILKNRGAGQPGQGAPPPQGSGQARPMLGATG